MNELNGLEILGRPMKVGEPRESGQTASDPAARYEFNGDPLLSPLLN